MPMTITTSAKTVDAVKDIQILLTPIKGNKVNIITNGPINMEITETITESRLLSIAS